MIDPTEKTNVDDNYRPPLDNLTMTTTPSIIAEQNYGIIDWFIKCLKNYVNFSGRARRKEYWYFALVQFVIVIIAITLDTLIFDSGIGLFYILALLSLMLPAIAVTIRRLHDTSRSGWWTLISFIPLIGSIILLVYLATETSQESNQWGPPAK